MNFKATAKKTNVQKIDHIVNKVVVIFVIGELLFVMDSITKNI